MSLRLEPSILLNQTFEGTTICPKCGVVANYEPYSELISCRNCGNFKNDSDKIKWLEKLNK